MFSHPIKEDPVCKNIAMKLPEILEKRLEEHEKSVKVVKEKLRALVLDNLWQNVYAYQVKQLCGETLELMYDLLDLQEKAMNLEEDPKEPWYAEFSKDIKEEYQMLLESYRNLEEAYQQAPYFITTLVSNLILKGRRSAGF